MTETLIKAEDTQDWRRALGVFARVDVCHMPEYHRAYATRTGSRAVMWRYEDNNGIFCYPFMLTPVVISEKSLPYTDISSVYGYSGPLSTTENERFLNDAWAAFDTWAAKQNAIAEFTAFSPYAGTRAFAHTQTETELNRELAVSNLSGDEEALLSALGKKTRNMLRKAEKSGLEARELDLKKDLSIFRALYEETMDRNDAGDFFLYDDEYYGHLLKLPAGELRLFGVFEGDKMVAAALGLTHGENALYHLGASLPDYAKLGAGNLSLFAMTKAFMSSNITFINMTGGRTTADDDPLLRFKKSNATDTAPFYIGKRILDEAAYAEVVKAWEAHYNTKISSTKLIFWR